MQLLTGFPTYNFGGNTVGGMSAHYHLSRDAQELDLYDYHIMSAIPLPSVNDIKKVLDFITPKTVILPMPGAEGHLHSGGDNDRGFVDKIKGWLGL